MPPPRERRQGALANEENAALAGASRRGAGAESGGSSAGDDQAVAAAALVAAVAAVARSNRGDVDAGGENAAELSGNNGNRRLAGGENGGMDPVNNQGRAVNGNAGVAAEEAANAVAVAVEAEPPQEGIGGGGAGDGGGPVPGKVVEGGMAVNPNPVGGGGSSSENPRMKLSKDCDLILLVECVEDLTNLAPHCPILRKGITVSIGLDKNTKLSAVFDRYCEVASSHIQPPTPQPLHRTPSAIPSSLTARDDAGGLRASVPAVRLPSRHHPLPSSRLPSASNSLSVPNAQTTTAASGLLPVAASSPFYSPIRSADLEFWHCSLLNPSDTAEASALMKNDKIQCRAARREEREQATEFRRKQRESDRKYFDQLRSLLPNVPAAPLSSTPAASAAAANTLRPMEGGPLLASASNPTAVATAMRFEDRSSATAVSAVGSLSPAPDVLASSASGSPSSSGNGTPRLYDLVIQCTGRIHDGDGYRQQVLTPLVRAHTALISKRCPWLRRLIHTAREKLKEEKRINESQSELITKDNSHDKSQGDIVMMNNGVQADGNLSNVVRIVEGDGNAAFLREDEPDNDNVSMVNERSHGSPENNSNRILQCHNQRSTLARMASHDEYDGVCGLPCPPRDSSSLPLSTRGIAQAPKASFSSSSTSAAVVGTARNMAAAEVEYFDEEERGTVPDTRPRMRSPIPFASAPSNLSSSFPQRNGDDDALWITVDHPPEAVKLLLEYCYTNRVVPLGADAFYLASKESRTTPSSLPSGIPPLGPVAPFAPKSFGQSPPLHNRDWPEHGLPTVKFHVALAGVVLAEEASLDRFSLMCEVAASRLVKSQTVLDALAASSIQYQRTGNRLPILRDAAVRNIILGRGTRGVSDLSTTPSFSRTLKEKSHLVVPSLLVGTIEVVKVFGDKSSLAENSGSENEGKGRKRPVSEKAKILFDEVDHNDIFLRERERIKRRRERASANGDISSRTCAFISQPSAAAIVASLGLQADEFWTDIGDDRDTDVSASRDGVEARIALLRNEQLAGNGSVNIGGNAAASSFLSSSGRIWSSGSRALQRRLTSSMAATSSLRNRRDRAAEALFVASVHNGQAIARARDSLRGAASATSSGAGAHHGTSSHHVQGRFGGGRAFRNRRRSGNSK